MGGLLASAVANDQRLLHIPGLQPRAQQQAGRGSGFASLDKLVGGPAAVVPCLLQMHLSRETVAVQWWTSLQGPGLTAALSTLMD